MRECIAMLCAMAATAAAQPASSSSSSLPAATAAAQPASSSSSSSSSAPAAPASSPSALPAPAATAPASPTVAAAPKPEELAAPGEIHLTLARAVELAMSQQASMRQAAATVEAASARVEQARVPLHPTGTAAASLTQGSGPTFFESSTSTGLSATLSWRIYDFGQTAASVRAAAASASAASASFETTGQDVRSGVEVAYLEAVARQRLVAVAQAAVTSEQAHLEQARRFVAAQARDPIEVAQAQARAASARSAAAQAESNQAVALANLRAAIGWLDPTRQVTIEPSWPEADVEQRRGPAELAELVAAAREQRPELVQLDQQIAASEASLEAANRESRPTLSAFANTQWSPTQRDWTPEPGWSAGVNLSWQFWDGGRKAADRKVAAANLHAAQAQRDQLLTSLTAALEGTRARIVANDANLQAST
jgi:outer membrane protein